MVSDRARVSSWPCEGGIVYVNEVRTRSYAVSQRSIAGLSGVWESCDGFIQQCATTKDGRSGKTMQNARPETRGWFFDVPVHSRDVNLA